jgi:catechol 2,3-dioxygenase-like lactoylglutathione lyase family enzyme
VLRHATIRVSDQAASAAFYSAVLATIGLSAERGEDGVAEWDGFRLVPADDDHPVTRNLHIGFGAPSRDHVDGFWRTGVDAGYRDDGPPGPRTVYGPDYYGGFLLDPDGNSAEAVHHDDVRPPGCVDHLWIRVADVAAARRFYAGLAADAGLELGTDTPERVQFRGAGGSFSLVAGAAPTQNVELAFPAAAGAEPGVRRDPDGNVVELVRRVT